MPGTSSASDATGPPGSVFDVSRGCVDDGPGLRTVVFLKGCPLACPWCQNPEGQAGSPEIAFDTGGCVDCGACREACLRTWTTDWREGCTACGRCAAICPSRARRLAGRRTTVTDLVGEVEVDLDFFEGTGGGVTFSGGEPLAQPGFLFACAGALRERGVHLAVETSGAWPGRLVDQVVACFDLVLFDLKHVDPKRCRELLGVASASILDNLERLLSEPIDVEVRLTLVPGFNDSEQDLAAIAAWLGCLSPVPALLLQPFHRLAAAKQHLFGRTYAYADVAPSTGEQVHLARERLGHLGIPAAQGDCRDDDSQTCPGNGCP